MTLLPLWTTGPFELLVHAEGHLRGGEDFDRRIALVSFDNAIEVAIATYLTLHPIHRGNRTYETAEVQKWLKDYHTKLDFLAFELTKRQLTWEVDRPHIIWCHDNRNEQYHGGKKGTPDKTVLALIRKAALWVFEILFDVSDAEQRLELAIAENALQSTPPRDHAFDHAIDRAFGMVDLAGQTFYASEVLFAVDNAVYRDVGVRLCQEPSETQEMESST